MYSFTRKKGNVGEELAVEYLEKKGYEILDRNYRKKWGEIDIVAEDDDGTIVFVEVKTSYGGDYSIEDNVHFKKQQRLKRAARTYLAACDFMDRQWQIDVLVVRMGSGLKETKFKHLEQAVVE